MEKENVPKKFKTNHNILKFLILCYHIRCRWGNPKKGLFDFECLDILAPVLVRLVRDILSWSGVIYRDAGDATYRLLPCPTIYYDEKIFFEKSKNYTYYNYFQNYLNV